MKSQIDQAVEDLGVELARQLPIKPDKDTDLPEGELAVGRGVAAAAIGLVRAMCIVRGELLDVIQSQQAIIDNLAARVQKLESSRKAQAADPMHGT